MDISRGDYLPDGRRGGNRRVVRFEKEEVATAQSIEEIQKLRKIHQEMSFWN